MLLSRSCVGLRPALPLGHHASVQGIRLTTGRPGFVLARAASGIAEAAPKKKPRRLFRKVLAATLVGGIGTASALSYKSVQQRHETSRKIRSVEERPVPTRTQNLERMRSGEEFDVLVVGGGSVGAGIALEAQLRGLSVCCVEQEDFASGTSSKSTKLLWAGSRYLVKGLVKLFSLSSLSDPSGSLSEFLGVWNMVVGCFRERRYMLETNPHLTNWVPIAVPLDRWIIWPPPFDYPPAALGPATGLFVFFFKFYDAMSLWSAPSSYVMMKGRVREEFPQIDAERMKYMSVFYEGAHNDARTNIAIAMTAAMHGACMMNYARVNKILFDANGVANGAEVQETTGPETKPVNVKAKKVIYAGGPFTDGLRELSEGKDVKPVVNGSGGTHIVLPPYYCPRRLGMVDMNTSRGSFMFFLPWEGYTLVGTTDVKTKPDLHHEVPEDEIQYLINECEKYLDPNLQVRRRDVMSAWYGIRPLAVDPNATDQSSVSRDHVVSHHPSNGITFVSGGKWTTWREMSEDTVEQVLELHEELHNKAGPSRSLQTPLLGTGRTEFFEDGWHENLAIRLSQKFDLAFDVSEHLARNYGTRAAEVLDFAEKDSVKGSRSGLYKHYPRLYEGAAATTGYPYLEAEVRYAIEHEYAMTPADILARRTRLAFVNSTAAKLMVPRVVEIMGDYMGWDEARREQERQRADTVLNKDFAGPVPNKSGAHLRTACVSDVKEVFDHIDINRRGYLDRVGIAAAAEKLGFPLANKELDSAMAEMDATGNHEITFPEFLEWWNSSEESVALRDKILKSRVPR